MAVVPITVVVSLCLVFTFLVFFLGQHARGRLSSSERDSLLPLEEEKPLIAPRRGARSRSHAHDHDACGCRNGRRPPCEGCLRGKSAPHA